MSFGFCTATMLVAALLDLGRRGACFCKNGGTSLCRWADLADRVGEPGLAGG